MYMYNYVLIQVYNYCTTAQPHKMTETTPTCTETHTIDDHLWSLEATPTSTEAPPTSTEATHFRIIACQLQNLRHNCPEGTPTSTEATPT